MSLFGKVSTSHLFYVWAMKAFAKENYILFYSVVFWIVECGKIFAFISERETGGGGGWGSIHDSRIWKTLTSTDHLQKINNDWRTIHPSILISVPFIHSFIGIEFGMFWRRQTFFREEEVEWKQPSVTIILLHIKIFNDFQQFLPSIYYMYTHQDFQ